MSILSEFINNIESNIIDDNYQLSKYKDDIITYYWPDKNIILDIIIKDFICTINKNGEIFIFFFNNKNKNNLILNIMGILEQY